MWLIPQPHDCTPDGIYGKRIKLQLQLIQAFFRKMFYGDTKTEKLRNDLYYITICLAKI